jgi:hypothetical protein
MNVRLLNLIPESLINGKDTDARVMIYKCGTGGAVQILPI